ncbi:MAG: succinate--CoA ligase subunit alpha [Theionarchaea archaeon]|nr:succinate--CoA ligase subunit alpha [Theionarchaea archaeon]MBU7036839.1 succinate--CoA ligase subunit alpha [Theionarchaea archaeon]
MLIDENTRIVVQNITGTQGQFHAKSMLDYGTKIVAGATPGKGGQSVHNIPVYDTVAEAKAETGVTASIIFVPAPFAKDAVLESIGSGLNPIVVITEHVPVHDSIMFIQLAVSKEISVIGPNTPGMMVPEKCKLGIMPSHIFKAGPVGVASRSGTLTYEIVTDLTRNGLGQSTVVGLGGDPVVGFNFIDALKKYEREKETQAVVLIGEIGGNAEELASEFIKEFIDKPVVAYVAGKTAPKGKRMGHAGAVISGKTGTVESKVEAFKKAKVPVADTPDNIAELLQDML